MFLIHGMLTPWQVWQPQISAFSPDYRIIVPALSAHTEEAPSEFVSLEAEADTLEQYCTEQQITEIAVLCGMSLGGAIAQTFWSRTKIPVRQLILDGAPLLPFSAITERVMQMSYRTLLKKSKQHDKKILARFKTEFLPEQYLEPYLRIADNMSEQSAEQLVRAACSCRIGEHAAQSSRILFLHGTKKNEVLAKKSALRLKALYPQTEILCYEGDPHIFKAVYRPEIWIADVRRFLEAGAAE